MVSAQDLQAVAAQVCPMLHGPAEGFLFELQGDPVFRDQIVWSRARMQGSGHDFSTVVVKLRIQDWNVASRV